MAPDLKKKVDAARAARLARENMTAEQLQAQVSSPRTLQTPFVDIYHLSLQLNDSDSQKPVWSNSRPPVS